MHKKRKGRENGLLASINAREGGGGVFAVACLLALVVAVFVTSCIFRLSVSNTDRDKFFVKQGLDELVEINHVLAFASAE